MTRISRFTRMTMALGAGTMALAPLAATAQDVSADAPANAKEQSRGETRLAKALEGRTAGEPVRCLSLNQIQDTTIYDGTAIVYRVGKTLYVNRPDSGAQALNRHDVMVTETHIGQLCSIDTVKMVDTTGFMRGVVFLGEFVPYTKPDKG